MQEIHLVGINHKTSKVSDRERFIVDDSNLVYLNDFLISKLDKKISGFFGLSTCNRTEIYFYGDKGIEDDVLKLTKEALNISDIPDKNFYIYDGLKAFEHMCRVCCGIDSQVVGEQEIFGQFKNAYNSAKAFRIVGKELMTYEFQLNMQLKQMEESIADKKETQKEDRKDQRVKLQGEEQRKSKKAAKNF